jgi:Ribbon-helix-helix domain
MTAMASAYRIAPEVKLKKATIWLGMSQWAALKKLSRRTLVPMSALIRKAVSELLEREAKQK